MLVLTAAFLGLYALGVKEAFDVVEAEQRGEVFDVDERELTGATMFGLSMFGTLFLGAVLAAFLTLGTVRGDAERGLLQPLVVRPIGRSSLLAGRFAAAERFGRPLPALPPTTALGALINHITGGHIETIDEGPRSFQPMNVNFGLFPPIAFSAKGEDGKRLRGPAKAWSDTRDLPLMAEEPFRDWWAKNRRGRRVR